MFLLFFNDACFIEKKVKNLKRGGVSEINSSEYTFNFWETEFVGGMKESSQIFFVIYRIPEIRPASISWRNRSTLFSNSANSEIKFLYKGRYCIHWGLPFGRNWRVKWTNGPGAPRSAMAADWWLAVRRFVSFTWRRISPFRTLPDKSATPPGRMWEM